MRSALRAIGEERAAKERLKMATLQCIIPAKFVSHNSRASRLWGVVRSLDHPENGGTGSGKVSIKIQELANLLSRSVRSAYRYIKAALQAKFIHGCQFSSDHLVIHYKSLTRIAKQLELSEIGPVAEFDLEEVSEAKTRASEAVAFHLQRASVYARKKEVKSKAKQVKPPDRLLVNCAVSDRMPGYGVIQRGHRLIYLNADWIPVGASEKRIAEYVGCSERTIQRRFSAQWRAEHGLEPLDKAQSARLIAGGMNPDERKFFIQCAPEEIRGRLVTFGRGVFLVGCNLYAPVASVRPQNYRREEYRQSIRDANCSQKISQIGAGAFIPITIPNQREPGPEPVQTISRQ